MSSIWPTVSCHALTSSIDTRHRNISRILSEPSIKPIFSQHSCLDSLPRDFHALCRSTFNTLHEFMRLTIKGPIIGTFYDNYGPRYIVLVGSFLHVFGLMMTSISTQYYQFILAQGICSSIGISCLFYPRMSFAILRSKVTNPFSNECGQYLVLQKASLCHWHHC